MGEAGQGESEPVFHLTPAEVWAAQRAGTHYRPEGFEREGFLHATVGADNLLATANRYYRADPRPHVALVIDLERVDAPVRIEDAEGIYPHVLGPLAVAAVVEVRTVRRGAHGTFLAID